MNNKYSKPSAKFPSFLKARIPQNGNTNFHKTKAVSYFLAEVKAILTKGD